MYKFLIALAVAFFFAACLAFGFSTIPLLGLGFMVAAFLTALIAGFTWEAKMLSDGYYIR